MRRTLMLMIALVSLLPAISATARPARTKAARAKAARTKAARTKAARAKAARAKAARAKAARASGEIEMAEIERDMTLPPMTLEPRGGVFLQRTTKVGRFRVTTNHVGLNIGAGLGIIDGLEAGIGAGFVPMAGPGLGMSITMAPDFDFGDAQLYGMYDLTRLLAPSFGDWFKGAVRLSLNIPFATDFHLIVDAPLKLRIHEIIAILVDVGLGTSQGKVDAFEMGVQAGALIQAMESLALSTTMGLWGQIGNKNTLLVPLSFRGQFTVIQSLDIYLDFTLVDLNDVPGWFLIRAGVAYRIPLS